MDIEAQYRIDPDTCEWTVRAMSALKSRLALEIRLHQHDRQLEQGQIFLFNHFARFETFIPQYLIYQQLRAYCRSIASSEFFAQDDAFARFLRQLGAVPNNHPRLLPFLAEEILHGRKVIVFPEGGMVKDRRVLDRQGQYSIFSPVAGERRKHHTGAAALAMTLDLFKTAIRAFDDAGERDRVQAWAQALGFDKVEEFLAAVRRPTLIVPGNITFYPIRASDNLLHRAASLFIRQMGDRFIEELLIEGNLLLKDTDMDIRLGDPLEPDAMLHWWERPMAADLVRRANRIDELFHLSAEAASLKDRFFAKAVRGKTTRLRDLYMRRMYERVTVNLSHLASSVILEFVDKGRTEVDRDTFHRAVYLAIKNAQKEPTIHLHRGLVAPIGYDGVLDGTCGGFQQYLKSVEDAGLVERSPTGYRFLPKLLAEHEFHKIRVENPVVVYANEVAPLEAVQRAVEGAVTVAPDAEDHVLARLLFEDELAAADWDKRYFSLARYQEINRQETATESGEPFLFVPGGKRPLGVVLVHGFLASPAEVKGFGEKLAQAGYPVIGVRLKGHGTSPWDLRGRSWQDWLASVRRGYQIMSAFADRLCLVGFSTGGALSLLLAAENPARLAGVAAISVPMKFRNRNLVFVPLVRGANKLVRLVSASEGVMLFRPNDSEHPHINYRNIPVRSLHELTRMVSVLKQDLPKIACPLTVLQGTEDKVVDPVSAKIVIDLVASQHKTVHMIPSDRHGILHEDIGDTQAKVMAFVESLAPAEVQDAKILMAPELHRPAARKRHPWESAYPPGLDWGAPIPVRPMATLLDEAVSRFGDRPCLDFLGKTYTYREVGNLVNRAAKGFRQLGVERGVHVGLCLPNSPYYVICYYAVLKAGGTVVNYNPLYSERELEGQVADSETRIMVTLDLKQMYPKIAGLLGKTPLRTIVVCPMSDILPTVKGVLFATLKRSEIAAIPDDLRHVPFARLVGNDGVVDAADVDPYKDVAVLQYTGGTTGVPKGAMLTHANLSANAAQVRRWFPGMAEGEERILAVLPFFHVFAMTVCMNVGIASGAELILLPRFELNQVLKIIDSRKPTLFPGVPTVFNAINNSPDLDKYDLSSIKFCLSGGAPLLAEVKARFEGLTGCVLVEGYGLSESSPVATCNPLQGIAKEGSIGIPLPGTIVDIRAPDEPQTVLPPREVGEICISGPQVMAGYWKRDKETEAVIIGGRLHTGDLGYMDDDGYVFLIDRLKDIIICSGYKVYPRVVEEAISLHPAVEEVTVIGVPDEYRGESPKAFIKLRPGRTLTAQELDEFLRDKLSPMERPEAVEFRDELPKTLIGKPSKKALAEQESKRVTKKAS